METGDSPTFNQAEVTDYSRYATGDGFETAAAATPGAEFFRSHVGDDPYVLDAELTFSDRSLVLFPTLSTNPDCSFSLDFWTGGTLPEEVLYVTVVGEEFEGVADSLVADPTVRESSLIARFEAEAVYRIRPTAAARRVVAPIGAAGGYVRSVRGSAEGWTVRMHLPDRATLSELNDTYRGEGVSVSVSHLGDLESADEPNPSRLSLEQRELLLVACKEGYFDVPRGISQRDLAERFGVSPSAISQRLRTAMGSLVATTFNC